MSSTTSPSGLDSSGHPGVETISDYLEDLLAPDMAARIHAHLADCAECAETRDALDEIRSLLGDTDTPHLPTDVGIRIDAALAAEALLSASPPTEPSAHTAASSPSAPNPAPGRAAPTHRRPPGRPDGSAPPARARTTRRLRKAVLGLTALALVGLAGVSIVRSSGSSSTTSAGSAAAGPVRGAAVPAGTTFTDAAFTQQVQQLLLSPTTSDRARSQGTRQESSGATPYAPKALPAPPLPACAGAPIGRSTEQPLTVSLGSYHGLTVYAVVYPDRADPAHSVDAYLVDASCENAASGQTSRGILLQQTVPRD